MSRDPYEVLGVSRSASREDLHDAYRRLVKLHHPDRNGGSPESARRFQEVQEAYDRVRDTRPERPQARRAESSRAEDPAVERRMADLERELREARATYEGVRQAARDAVREATERPSDEDLGYVTTDDSFGKILADVRDELSGRLADARKHPAVQRVADIVDGLDELTSRFDRRQDGR
jgi:curved DNA-binding protein CbpA